MRKALLAFCVLFSTLCAEESCCEKQCPAPWFTGPLLTPSGHAVPRGYINIEPYIFYTVDTGAYDDNWDSFSLPNFTSNMYSYLMWVGLTKWMDISIVTGGAWQNTQGVSSLVYNDFLLEFNIQLLQDTLENSVPGIKFYVSETFPTGRFQKLNPEKKGTDSGGNGTFNSVAALVITRTFQLPQCHYLPVRLNGFVNIPTNVSVEGLNTYGGAPDTRARIKTPLTWGLLLGIEYNLTQNWALALDVDTRWESKRSFSRFPGTGPDGKLLDLSKPPSFRLALAPAIEYNFSSGLGLIGGLWFTTLGRNAPRFISGVIAFNYYGPLSKSAAKSKADIYRSTGGAGGQ